MISAELLLDEALAALDRDDWRSALDRLPVPIYRTDVDGNVTYWNQACVDFAGRQPELGQDQWCVTWKIYKTTGELLPHDQCPMADAINQRREVRGAVAIAMRPDGSRRAFTPYPTPLFDDSGVFIGAVNMLVDVSDEQSGVLAEQAERCRRLALWSTDEATRDVLTDMALNYDATAMALGESKHLH
ncbi:MAG TPA: PAS domain-containing protein [Sphingomicrobium sp.]|nr:PAS domain-containing protein [Sphingomicrobium sp.]